VVDFEQVRSRLELLTGGQICLQELLSQVGWDASHMWRGFARLRDEAHEVDLSRLGPWNELFYQEMVVATVQGVHDLDKKEDLEALESTQN
jgi:hypothetical protein